MGFLSQDINDRWAIYNGDSMDMLAMIPNDTIHGSIYSPPFGGLFHYSSDDRDLSNARDYEEFFEVYRYFVDELHRVLIPGRTVGVHASLVPTSNTGRDGYTDFPGDVIRAHQARGFEFIGRHVIWKEPLAVRLRTMVKNLAHATIVEDGAMGGFAAPDELLVFRKRGEGIPVAHPYGLFNGYAGSEPIPAEYQRFRMWDGDQKQNRYSHHVWRRYASSVWDDVRMDRVLPFRDSKDPDDEKHVHPLQLDVIERYLDLRTNPGEKVLTPFMGVGSEVYAAVQMKRVALGCELKPSYYVQATRNLAAVDDVTADDEDFLFDTDPAFADAW